MRAKSGAIKSINVSVYTHACTHQYSDALYMVISSLQLGLQNPAGVFRFFPFCTIKIHHFPIETGPWGVFNCPQSNPALSLFARVCFCKCLSADVWHRISFKQFNLLNVSCWQKIRSKREVAEVSGWTPAGLEEPFSNTTYTLLSPLFSSSYSVHSLPLLPSTSLPSVNPHIHWVYVKLHPL